MKMDTSINILIVDDLKSMRRIIIGALNQLGFNNLFEAEDGEAALKELRKEKIGLIVSDWYMPNMTGLELLKAVRADDNFKGIPFLMVTTDSKKENVIQAVQSGVSNYIIKPFTPETFNAKLEKIFP
jgi:two-component system, chemotaxis family, chemotaxis protein CheY